MRMTAKQLLEKYGYVGDEILMNAPTGSVDTAENWADDYETGFKPDGSHDWDCFFCSENPGESHECNGTPEEQFSALVQVEKDGDYREVE